MSGHYVALRLRASLCIYLSSLGDMCWSLDGLQLVYGMEFISKGGVKIWHLWWDESIGSFLHWRKSICFSPWAHHLNRDGWHRICMFHILHVLLEMTKPNNDILFVFFEYCDCTENTVRIWIRRVTWKINIFSISFTLVFVDEVHEGIGRRS